MTNPALLLVVALTFTADQLTKAAALAKLVQGEHVSVMPGFNLTLSFNEGSSFGMLSGVMAGKPLLMAALTGVLTLMFAVMALRARHPLERAGLALVVGGAFGNIIDRLRQGAVTDFLDLYWRDWHWPTFNVADIAITLGALCILLASIPSRRLKDPALDQS
jgi:signal peptidase II